ncbi:tripartite tricarboxylate transporter TctB family protein [Porticoccaceae bacterium]|nr:tripartite tricarboxylate transporter TctB family protein [Porticoccaceae bacterium]MDB2533138.1 tripartite tricarboxylate transporter TctB family protein [Porticoccaceae bacterium]MDC0589995.1 tripartite tricarboxylate transporter TctB family protein [Porticoccaceae bacterium]
MKSVRFNSHQVADLSVLFILFCLVLWYFWDAYTTSNEVLNLILILPVTLVVLVFCAVEFFSQISHRDSEQPELDSASTIVPVVTLFSSYVITLPWLGFDVGTFLFISLFLWFHGERRWQWVLGYGLCASTLISLFFSAMLPYPMPMLLMATDY